MKLSRLTHCFCSLTGYLICIYLRRGIDPFVVIKYKSQEQNSTVAKGAGSKPVWNEKFSFRVQYPDNTGANGYKLILKIMDKDSFTAADFIGETVIYVDDLLSLGVEKGKPEIHPATKYRVVASDKSYNGEIRVALSFVSQDGYEEEKLGGWRHGLHHHHHDKDE
ncbi:hypothetical protein MKW94_003671 [Papaver nudicaule]|uniref:C2 domain-containing protein n=1 Tax=Papaver nudicaule TaxID=74823 RepID=A0AA41S9D5_PAPNU|nr:hypothetical protein [Papaver nudicaule]